MNDFSRYLACALALTACSDTTAVAPPTAEVRPAPIGAPYDTLREWGLFADAAARASHADRFFGLGDLDVAEAGPLV